jgi:hypothetical protein
MSDNTLDTNTAIAEPSLEQSIDDTSPQEEPVLTLVEPQISIKDVKTSLATFFKNITDQNFDSANTNLDQFIEFAQSHPSEDTKKVLVSAFHMAVSIETYRLNQNSKDKKRPQRALIKDALKTYQTKM